MENITIKFSRHKPIILPVKNHSNYPPQNPYYIPDEQNFYMLAYSLFKNEPVLLYGHTQSGKTSLVHYLANLTKWRLVEIDCSGQTTVEDLLGNWMIAPSANGQIMVFKDGVVTEAYRNGYILVLNEFDMLKPEIVTSLNDTIFSKLRNFTISHTTSDGKIINETVNCHPDFRIVATSNTKGYGDTTNVYDGIEFQNASVLERFSIKIKFNYPKPHIEKAILKKYNSDLSSSELNKIIDFATTIRNLFNNQMIRTIISTYRLIKLVEILKYVDIITAFIHTILFHSYENDELLIMSIFEKYFIKGKKDLLKLYSMYYSKKYTCYGSKTCTETECKAYPYCKEEKSGNK